VSQASDLIGATGHPAVPVTPDVSDPSSIEAAHDADSGLGGFHADVADAKSSFYSDVLDREKSGVAGVVAAMLGGPCCACGTDGVLPRGGGALGINGPRSCCGDAAYCGCGPAGVPG
jgi:hypothetical protein